MEALRISLKAARINAQLSQKCAAQQLGISIATLQNYENGRTVPNWDMVKKIESLYRLSADYICFTSNYA